MTTNTKINLNDVDEELLVIKLFTRTLRHLLSLPGTVISNIDDGIDSLDLVDHLDAKIDEQIKDYLERKDFVHADD